MINNNATTKDDGGIVGLTQDTDSLLRWALAGPETICIISEFKYSITGNEETSSNTKHHEQTQAHRKRFVYQVKSLVQVIQSQGNPFKDTMDLIRLDTREIMDTISAECIITIQERGQEQYNSFAEEWLRQEVKPIDAPITGNKVNLFNTVPQKKTKSLMATGSLKSEANLFARLYVACQTRDGDIDEFFRHENHAYPPALSSYGQLRKGKKSDLIPCLET